MRAGIASVCAAIGIAAGGLAPGCDSSGALQLDLQLPTADDLRPTGMTSITVLATSPEIPPIANTSQIHDDGSFSAGEFPVASDVEISVLLRNDQNRLVGLGEASEPIEISGKDTTQLSIPVRKPFVYAADGTNLYSYDATLDPRADKFQGMLGNITSPQMAISVGGTRLVVAGGSQLQVIDTATNMLIGRAIQLGAVTVQDLAPVPGTSKVVVAHSMGMTIVDLDGGEPTPVMVGSVDRVSVGSGGGKMLAFGLVGRVAPPETPLTGCAGASQLVVVDLAAPAGAAPKPLGAAVSDIAATNDPDHPLFATLPCMNQVAALASAPESAPSLMKVSDLPNAAVIAAAGERVIAVGTSPSQPVCETGGGNPATCSGTSTISCPEQNTTHVAYAVIGAHTIIQSIPVAGGAVLKVEAPERRETMIDTSDPAEQHTEVLHALSAQPLDLVVLPGGQYVSLITKSRYYLERLDSGIGVLIPCLDATTYNWLMFDLASASVAQRIRTTCDLTQTPASTVFGPFKCDTPPDGESSKLGPYQPTSVGALFGAR